MSTKLKDNTRPYTSRGGRRLFKPSIQLCMVMNGSSEGFCLACGEIQGGVEPDAHHYSCQACDETMVFGAEELVMRDLTFDAP
jgi:hypothetical protein